MRVHDSQAYRKVGVTMERISRILELREFYGDLSNLIANLRDKFTALTTICNKIWQTGEWPTPWTLSLVITLPKKGNLQQYQNYRTISLISHPSKQSSTIIIIIIIITII